MGIVHCLEVRSEKMLLPKKPTLRLPYNRLLLYSLTGDGPSGERQVLPSPHRVHRLPSGGLHLQGFIALFLDRVGL